MLRKILCLVMLLAVVSQADAGTINRPAKTFGGSSFLNGVTPQASDFNGDHDTIYSEFNGNISNANISASAAIAATKINPDGFTIQLRTVNSMPCYILDESDQAGDAKRWALCADTGHFEINTFSDANGVQNKWLDIQRSTGGFDIGGVSGTNTISGNTTFNQTVTFSGGTSLTPTGMVTYYMGTVAPAGWLLMDGASSSCTGAAAVNASLCANLVSLYGTANYKGTPATTFTVDVGTDEIIHTAHGKSVGDRVHFTSDTTLPSPLVATTVYCIESTTTDRYKIATTCGGADVDIANVGTGTHSVYYNFVTPDARGRNVLGTGTGAGLTARTIGASGGEETHLLLSAESGIVNHTHTITDPGHDHGNLVLQNDGGTTNLAVDTGLLEDGGNTFMDPVTSATTGITGTNGSGSANASTPHAVLDPFIVMTYIIKL